MKILAALLLGSGSVLNVEASNLVILKEKDVHYGLVLQPLRGRRQLDVFTDNRFWKDLPPARYQIDVDQIQPVPSAPMIYSNSILMGVLAECRSDRSW